MLRRLRVLAAFAFIPVVVLGTTSPASALNGPWTTVSITVNTPFVEDAAPGVECSFSLQQRPEGQAIGVGVNGRCLGLPDVSPGFAQDGEAGSAFSLLVKGLTSDSQTCSGSNTSTLGQHPSNGTLRVAGAIMGQTLQVGTDDCSITEVCIGLRAPADHCTPVSIPSVPLDDEEEPGDSCRFGTARAWISYQHDGRTLNQINYDRVFLNWSLSGSPGPSTAFWGASVNGIQTGGSQHVVTNENKILLDQRGRWSDTGEIWEPHGGMIELYAYFDGGWNNVPKDNYSAVVPTEVPSGPNQPYMGITDPGHCRFYFGPKIVNFSGTEVDEPAGDGLEPTITDPPPPPPEPEVEDPDPETDDTNWLSKIWHVLVSILAAARGLVAAILGLADDIVQGVGDLLDGLFTDLFVPSDDFMDQRSGSIRQSWEQTSVAKYKAALDDFEPGQVSGCGGLPLQVTLPGGVQVDQQIGYACAGKMAEAAGVVRVALGAVFVVGGVFACVRAVGSGLSWDPGVGRGAAS